MSYVFSKALQETPEEKQRRKSVPPKWIPPPSAAAHPKGKVPPPVARKPSTGAPPKQGTSVQNDINVSQRKMSLPARTSSFDGDYGTGPKMGGAFARLQANLEKDEDQKGTSSIYSEVYEAYKIKRSLKEHGCLPTNMRSDERLRRYSLDRTAPPVVMPKPRRSTADSKRGAFAQNRSMTTPTSPTANYFGDDVFSKEIVAKPKSPVAEIKEIPNFDVNSLDIKIDDVPPESIGSPKSPFGDPDEIKKLESSNDVQAMKVAIEQEKTEQLESQRKLSETISELDSISFDDLKLSSTAIIPENNTISEDTAPETFTPLEGETPNVTSEPINNESNNAINEAHSQLNDAENKEKHETVKDSPVLETGNEVEKPESILQVENAEPETAEQASVIHENEANSVENVKININDSGIVIEDSTIENESGPIMNGNSDDSPDEKKAANDNNVSTEIDVKNTVDENNLSKTLENGDLFETKVDNMCENKDPVDIQTTENNTQKNGIDLNEVLPDLSVKDSTQESKATDPIEFKTNEKVTELTETNIDDVKDDVTHDDVKTEVNNNAEDSIRMPLETSI